MLVLIKIMMMAGLHSALGATSTIRYDALQDLEGSASIGRGYTLSTNLLHSTCMNMTDNATSVQESYNYDCKYHV